VATDQDDPRLSRISTLWTLISQANDGEAAGVRLARQRLLDRYGGAIRRYLIAVLRDPDAAADMFQEFAVRFLRGDLRGASAQRGRFRAFVKGVLFHLIADHHQRRQRQHRQMSPDFPEPAESGCPNESDEAFLAGWRDELLARAWAALERAERSTGRPLYTVLRFRADHPDLSSAGMAESLGAALGSRLTAAGVRQTLHRARDQFADLLLDEVEQSLPDPVSEHLADELADLGLLDYCRAALERREQGGRG
jgi:RNA polymerase sigma-70 factor (ECF subfamily)